MMVLGILGLEGYYAWAPLIFVLFLAMLGQFFKNGFKTDAPGFVIIDLINAIWKSLGCGGIVVITIIFLILYLVLKN